MSAMFDYVTGKRVGNVAALKAELEHVSGYLGAEIEEADAARAAFLAHLQGENNCRQTGEPCREWSKCDCWLEMDAAIEKRFTDNRKTPRRRRAPRLPSRI